MAVDSAINNAYFIVFYKTESFTALAVKYDSKQTAKYVKILLFTFEASTFFLQMPTMMLFLRS